MLEKENLLADLTGLNRGLLATAAQKERIAIAIAQLEMRNPTPQPTASALLVGDWRLLYTTSAELLGLDRVPLVNLGEIYQCIREDGSKLYNIAEVAGIPFLAGIISVVADFSIVSERRVTVQFNRAIWGARGLMKYRDAAGFIAAIEAGQRFAAIDFKIPAQERSGWVDITYLDEDLRIGRGNVGSLFVLQRV
jgi:hypothetical protein